MKKIYVSPNSKCIEVRNCDIICQSPESAPVGGTTPSFSTSEYRSILWDED